MTAATTVAVAMSLAALVFAVAPEARSRITRRTADRHRQMSAHARILAPTAATSIVDTREINDTQATGGANDPVATEPAWLRALRARVHILEATLADQEASLARAQERLDESDRREGDLARIRLILQALRERVSGNPESQGVLDRVEAAVSRLAPPSGLLRPSLPAPVTGAGPALVARPPRAAPDAAHAAPPVAVVPKRPARMPPAAATAPAAEPPPEAPDRSAAVKPPAVPPAAAARVLPVPAPPVQSVPRAGRWRRRGAL
jgi:hypothetical protein